MSSFDTAGADVFKEEWFKEAKEPDFGAYYVAVDIWQARQVSQTGGVGMDGISASPYRMGYQLINDATGILIDAFSDVDKVLAYLTSRIEAATQFANESAIRGETAAAMGALETRNLFRSQAELLRTQARHGNHPDC